MKKTYIAPKVLVKVVSCNNILAGSNLGLTSTKATDASLARRGRSRNDDFFEDEY